MNKKIIISWTLVIILMFIIFYFSNQESVVSSSTSSGLTKVIFDSFRLNDVLVFENFNGLIRKIAHFSIYGLLGLLLYNAIFNTIKKDFLSILLYAIVFAFVYALTDEFHQLFVAGRSAELRDIFIDTSGGSVGALLYYFYLKIRYGQNGLQK